MAQRKYEKRIAEKPKYIHFTEDVKQHVIAELKADFSHEQIVGKSKLKGERCVSHETIYRFLWADKKRGDILKNKGKKYNKRGLYRSLRGLIKDRVSIEERPKIVDEKLRFGDLEIDTITGKNHKGTLLTITGRSSLMEWIVKLPSKNAVELATEAVKILKPFEQYLHTITSDNRKEFAEHKYISTGLKVGFYFFHPYKSCERGCNENENRLIRQYIPQKKLNNRPRKKTQFLNTK